MTSILDPLAVNLGDEENPFEDGPGNCPVCGAKGYSCREDAMLGSGGGVTIVRRVRTKDGEETGMHTLKAKTFVNADSTKVVPEGHVDAAYLLGLAGDEISDETATRLGLNHSGENETYSSKWAAMKVADLKDAAEERGIESAGDWKRADYVAAHEAKDAEEATASTDGDQGGTSDQGDAEGTKQAEKPAEA